MVKLFAVLLFFSFITLSLYADTNETLTVITDVIEKEDPLIEKIKGYIDTKQYNENRDFIKVIFDPKSDYYKNERVDAVKVMQTLKENGLLKLFFKKPIDLQLHFKTSGAPLFFVKIMGDTLRNIGYYRYVTTASSLDASEFTWSIGLSSEYVTDPLILEKELNKSGCYIIDISRNSATEWSYVIDMSDAHLNVDSLEVDMEMKLKRSLYAHWVNVSQIKSVVIYSSRRNRWYPNISFYDASLHLLKVIKKDKVFRKLYLNIPQNAKYMKISDLYTLKNVRDALRLVPSGAK